MRITSAVGAIAVALGALAWARLAAADNVKKADDLFHEGVKLRESNLEQACAKFVESLSYNDQAIGTLMNVALCDEKLGRIASAVARFTEARDRAREQSMPEHLKAAEDKIAALSPDLPYLRIKFAEPLPQTKVLIDDKLIPAQKIAKAERVAVDPGERIIVVTAPGRVAFQKKIVIAKSEQQDLEIPPLAKAVVKSSRRTIGKITVASGGAAIATGIVLGYIAHKRYDAEFEGATPRCFDDNGTLRCTGEGQGAIENARTLGNVATITTIVGVAAIAVGGYLWLFAPKPGKERKVSVVPHVDPAGGGVLVFGRF